GGELSPNPSPQRGGKLAATNPSTGNQPTCSPSPLRGGGRGERLTSALRYSGIPLVALAFALAYGQVALRGAAPPGKRLRIAVIQGNVERDDAGGSGRGPL